MNSIRLTILLLPFVFLLSCKKQTDTSTNTLYFPPYSGTQWDTMSITEAGFNASKLQPLKDYLAITNTKSFMIVKNGKIVVEEYYNSHTSSSTWQWNSAGKTLVATITGIAQQDGFLNINNKVSDYLGNGWTSENLLKENLIKIKHLLTMTSGLNDANQLVIKSNLTYLADAGTRWSYHNVFQKLIDVVASATSQNFENYFNNKLRDKIGMDGFWNFGTIFKIYHSNTRSMARFGLLTLNKGKWNNEQIINENFLLESTTPSQSINPSYGYFWWLNGKSSYMLPNAQTVYNSTLVPNAPIDMIAAMGAEDQRLYIIPSKNIVVVRMGDASDPSNPTFALSGFDNTFWSKLSAFIN
ncbi:MAG TPA: serine hydrolase [Chitinophagaceae bacterium]|nr:serine hydrolase [Chitinophagaceae bacterium]